MNAAKTIDKEGDGVDDLNASLATEEALINP
jgi:hypothetical protein